MYYNKFSTKALPKCLPEKAKELDVSVRHYAMGYPTQPDNLLHKKVSNKKCVICFVARNEMRHFAEAVNNHHDSVFASLCPR